MSYRDFREISLSIVLAALSRQDHNKGLNHTLFFCCPHNMLKDCGRSQSSPYGLMIKNRPRTLFVYRALPQQQPILNLNYYCDFIVNVFNPSRPYVLIRIKCKSNNWNHMSFLLCVRHALSYQYWLFYKVIITSSKTQQLLLWVVFLFANKLPLNGHWVPWSSSESFN